MKAIVHLSYGSPDVLELQDVDRPVIKDDEALVRVHAASVNPFDWHSLRGKPYMVRLSAELRRRTILGVDMAGRVEAVGRNVKRFRPGDEVFGASGRAFAEYVSVPENRIVKKPARLNFEQAAAVPLAGLTALQGLRDKGRIQQGQKVLINGASGGVGTFAVQIAKSLGAQVTGVCSARNVEMVRSIGAERVIDYTREDFSRDRQRYDLILDTVGNRPLSKFRRALRPQGVYVSVGAPLGNWIGPLTHLLKVKSASWIGGRHMIVLLARQTTADLIVLQELLETEKVTPVIGRRYPLNEVPEALRYQGEGHAQGKIVITM